MVANGSDTLIKKLEAMHVSIATALKSCAELEETSAQLRKQLESVKAESLKSKEYLQRLSKVRA